jgi:hypothetical protein
MRWCVPIGTLLVVCLLAAGDTKGIAAPGQKLESADSQTASSVDVELVIAVDVSYSMDLDELAVQREGYAQAIVSKEFLQALRTGLNARISLTYFEWSAASDQKIIIPWRLMPARDANPVRQDREPRAVSYSSAASSAALTWRAAHRD